MPHTKLARGQQFGGHGCRKHTHRGLTYQPASLTLVDMTTEPDEFFSPEWDPVLTQDLQNFLRGLGTDSSLFDPKQLRERLDALDTLDTRFGGFKAEDFMSDPD